MKFERGILIDRDSLTDVYRGRQRSSGQVVAMKGLREEFCSEASVSLFEREGGVGAQLHHPNVVRLLDVMREQGRPYLVLEALDGETLQSRLEQGALREDEAVDIAQQVASGLAQAHRQGLAHCALQPSLILLCRDQTAKIMDFGLSEFTAQLARMYPEVHADESVYLSPEQQRGETGDARSDIYALGVIMTEMLASAAPLSAEMTQNVHQNSDAESSSSTRLPQLPDSVSPRILAIIQKALQPEPIARFASGGEMLLALQDPTWRDRDAVQEALNEVRRDAAPRVESAPPVEVAQETPIREETKKPSSKMSGILIGGVLLLGALFAVPYQSGTTTNDDADAMSAVSHMKSARPTRATREPVAVYKPEAAKFAVTPRATTKLQPTTASKPIEKPPVILERTPQKVSAKMPQTAPGKAVVKSSIATRVQKLRARPAEKMASAQERANESSEAERARPIRRVQRIRVQRIRVQRIRRVRVRRSEPLQRLNRRIARPRQIARTRRPARVRRVAVRQVARRQVAVRRAPLRRVALRGAARPRATLRHIRTQALPF